MSISSIIENIEDRERDLESVVDNDHDDDGDEDGNEQDHSDDNGDGGDDDDKAGKAAAEDDGEEEDDEERSASLSEEARNKRREAAKARRQRRRANQHARDQRRDNYVRELEGTLENVAARLDQLEGRTRQQDDAGLDRMIRNADAMIENAKRELAAAQEAGDHPRVAQLIDDMTTFKADKIRLTEAKAAREAEAHDETKEDKAGKKPNGEDKEDKTQRKAGPDPIAVKNYGIFMKRNPLYRPDQPTNPITVAVHEIDTELTQEGWDPRTRDYWEEAEERARERGINLKDSKKSAAPRGERHSGDRGNGNKADNGGKGYTLSKARIDALKEAGLWDDPKKRAEMRARYEKQDRDMNQDNRRRA